MEDGDLEEATSPGVGLKHKCACCLLLLLLIAGGAGMAFSVWRSEARAETDAVRARLQSQWDRPDLHTPAMKPEVAQLLDIAVACERLEVSDALRNLRGSQVPSVRAALSDPTSPGADVTYKPESAEDPPTLLGAIAALKSATAALDDSLDSLVDWEVIKVERLRKGPSTSEDKEDSNRYLAISDLFYQLQHRALCASLRGDSARAWLEVEHIAQVCLLLSEPTSLFTFLVTRIRIEWLVTAVLSQLTEGPPPPNVARRLNKILLALERGLDPRRPLLGQLLWAEESLRADPDKSVAAAIAPPAPFQRAEVTLESRATGLVVLDAWSRDYLLRGEELLDAFGQHPRLLDFLAKAEGLCSAPATPFAKTFHEGYPKVIQEAIHVLALLRITRLAIASSRKEEPPALEDPWSDERLPLRWEKRRDGRLWIWSRGPDRQDNDAALSLTTREHLEEYPSPVLEQDPGSNAFGEEDVEVDLVRALPLGG